MAGDSAQEADAELLVRAGLPFFYRAAAGRRRPPPAAA
eukprot:SAG11_NODE_3633_length_2322_cov_22.753036_3_plen_37_part_01